MHDDITVIAVTMMSSCALVASYRVFARKWISSRLDARVNAIHCHSIYSCVWTLEKGLANFGHFYWDIFTGNSYEEETRTRLTN